MNSPQVPQQPVIAPSSRSYPWYSPRTSPQPWLPALLSVITPACFLLLGFALHGRALLPIALLGVIAASGITFGVIALVLARRAQDRRVVVLAFIGLALNAPLLVWAVRAIGMLLLRHTFNVGG